jgi:hypothetical protein
MSAGRPVKGPELVEELDGSEAAKRRVKVILETVSGQRTILDACIELGIGKSAFHELRNRVLQAALSDAEPRPVGRPPKEEPTAAEVDADRLKAENEHLRTELEIAQVREEILLAMPEVFERGGEKKSGPSPGHAPATRPKGGRRDRRASTSWRLSTSRWWCGSCGCGRPSGAGAPRHSRSGGRSSGW